VSFLASYTKRGEGSRRNSVEIPAQDHMGGGSSEGGVDKVLLFRGPRVRVAIDMGLPFKMGVRTATGRLMYRGKLVHRLGKCVSAAVSGQVLCTDEVMVAIQCGNWGNRRKRRPSTTAPADGKRQALSSLYGLNENLSGTSILMAEVAMLEVDEDEDDEAAELKFLRIDNSMADRAQLYEVRKGLPGCREPIPSAAAATRRASAGGSAPTAPPSRRASVDLSGMTGGLSGLRRSRLNPAAASNAVLAASGAPSGTTTPVLSGSHPATTSPLTEADRSSGMPPRPSLAALREISP